jgi:hypothetical protein
MAPVVGLNVEVGNIGMASNESDVLDPRYGNLT